MSSEKHKPCPTDGQNDLADLSLSALEDKLSLAQIKSEVAFDALGSTLGSAKEDGKGAGASAGASASAGDPAGLSVRLIDVQFSIPFETRVGQDLYVVGTWCDWDVNAGLALEYVEGGKWVGTMPLHPGYNYEYKYVVLDRRDGRRVGEPVGFFPEWGFAEPSLVASPKRLLSGDSSAYAAVWQKGNNKALALDNISTKGLDHIEARDEWVPDPKNSPIQLVGVRRRGEGDRRVDAPAHGVRQPRGRVPRGGQGADGGDVRHRRRRGQEAQGGGRGRRRRRRRRAHHRVTPKNEPEPSFRAG
jgi:hypothetical protein